MIHPLIQAVGHAARCRRRVNAVEPEVVTSIKEEPIPKTLVRDAAPTLFPPAASDESAARSLPCQYMVDRYLDQMEAGGSLPPPLRDAEPQWTRPASIPRGPREQPAKQRKPDARPTARQPAHVLACAQDSFVAPLRLVTG